MTKILKTLGKCIAYTPLLTLVYSIIGLIGSKWFVVPLITSLYLILKDTLGVVQFVGPIWWIIRPDERYIAVGTGTVHELSSPWRKGPGVYMCLFKRTFQTGYCRKQRLNDEHGTLSAIAGRYLDLSAHEIGAWNDLEKEARA